MDWPAWRYYAGYYRGRVRSLVGIVLASLASSALILPLILLVQFIFDRVLPQRDFKLLAICATTMFVATLASNLCTLWARRTSLRVTKTVIGEMRNELIAQLYRLSRRFFDEKDRMELHTVIVQDTERLDVMTNSLICDIMPAAAMTVVVSAVLLQLNWPLFLVVLAIAPLVYLANRFLGRRLQRLVSRFRRSFESFSRGVLFVLQALDLTRAHSAEPLEMKRQREFVDDLRQTSAEMAWFDTLYSSIQTTLSLFTTLLVLIVGGIAVANHRMSIGALLAFFVTVRLLNQYVQSALSAAPRIIVGNESLRTLHQLLHVTDFAPYQGVQPIQFTGNVTLDSVSFSYRAGWPVLRDASLRVVAGGTTALIGPNGCGKTTIIALLCGFYRPESGRVLADDVDFDRLDLRALRNGFGLVPQEPFLFPGTIRENIAYGRPGATDDEVIQAATHATAHNFIVQLENGYQTAVGERGGLLSGGQRQRIAIARALLHRPPLLILDEPTNHLDDQSVSVLMSNLVGLSPRPAILLISHNPEIVRHADTVYSVNNGRITASDPRPIGAAT